MESATTLNLPTPAARHDARAELAGAVDAFLAAGGLVVMLDGFEPKAMPPRRDPPPAKPAPRRRDSVEMLLSVHGAPVIHNRGQAVKARREREKLAPVIAQYAHLGWQVCKEMTGASEKHIRTVAREFGITLGRPN